MEITEEMIRDCVSDTSVNGKYYKLYTMLTDEIENQISNKKIESIKSTLDFVEIDYTNKNKAEILFEYSKLI